MSVIGLTSTLVARSILIAGCWASTQYWRIRHDLRI
jgi:hypothetical protein